MIWATWRQHRATLLAALGVIGVMLVAVVVSALILRADGEAHVLDGYNPCYDSSTATCRADGTLDWATHLAVALPILLGGFVGVTVFARDISRGTHVLGLSQSVSRARWFWSKLLVVFLPIIVATTMLGAALQWSRRGAFGFGTRFYNSALEFPTFQSSALVIGATTAFALVLGATIALLTRRTLASMALTVVISGLALVAIGGEARPHYTAPDIDAQGLEFGMAYYSLGATGDSQRIWTVDSGYVDASGRDVDVDLRSCQDQEGFTDYPEPTPEESAAAFDARLAAWREARDGAVVDCIQAQGAAHYQIKYHLESRFWRFQATEAAILLVLAGALLIPARWGLRRLRP